MTVSAIIGEPLRAYSVGTRAQRSTRVKELLELVGLDPRLGTRRPHELSGGQRQRVGIARAIALEPAVVICDEPVSSLDVSVRAGIINLLTTLQSDLGLAFLFITHDLRVVKTVASRIVVMYLGRVAESGPVASVLDSPRHPYTVALRESAEIDASSRETQVIRGEPASPIAPPSGCRFRTRCWKAQEICRNVAPPLVGGDSGTRVACHFPEGVV
jgi:oligopeptide/dipeptide ABC transporter ATP-binding protein